MVLKDREVQGACRVQSVVLQWRYSLIDWVAF